MANNQFQPGPGWKAYTPGRKNYPDLSANLRRELDAVPSSRDGDFLYKPCEITLSDGSVFDRVYIQHAAHYIPKWGMWPEDDRHKRSIDILKVVHITSSPTRLPVEIAERLYKGGESGMGYCLFTLVFFDGQRQAYITGNAVDFVPFPTGKTLNDVVDVSEHVENREAALPGCDYYWCLYGTGESRHQSWTRET
jgi:hypothetical protein